jgi:hypothetical protein
MSRAQSESLRQPRHLSRLFRLGPAGQPDSECTPECSPQASLDARAFAAAAAVSAGVTPPGGHSVGVRLAEASSDSRTCSEAAYIQVEAAAPPGSGAHRDARGREPTRTPTRSRRGPTRLIVTINLSDSEVKRVGTGSHGGQARPGRGAHGEWRPYGPVRLRASSSPATGCQVRVPVTGSLWTPTDSPWPRADVVGYQAAGGPFSVPHSATPGGCPQALAQSCRASDTRGSSGG